jgi:hypothetical protein
MMKGLLAFVLAGALMAPAIGLASESAFNNDGTGQAASKFPDKLPLPPIPHLKTMAWMNSYWETKRLSVDNPVAAQLRGPGDPERTGVCQQRHL